MKKEIKVEALWEINEICVQLKGIDYILLAPPNKKNNNSIYNQDGIAEFGQLSLSLEDAKNFCGQLLTAINDYEELDYMVKDHDGWFGNRMLFDCLSNELCSMSSSEFSKLLKTIPAGFIRVKLGSILLKERVQFRNKMNSKISEYGF